MFKSFFQEQSQEGFKQAFTGQEQKKLKSRFKQIAQDCAILQRFHDDAWVSPPDNKPCYRCSTEETEFKNRRDFRCEIGGKLPKMI